MEEIICPSNREKAGIVVPDRIAKKVPRIRLGCSLGSCDISFQKETFGVSSFFSAVSKSSSSSIFLLKKTHN